MAQKLGAGQMWTYLFPKFNGTRTTYVKNTLKWFPHGATIIYDIQAYPCKGTSGNCKSFQPLIQARLHPLLPLCLPVRKA